MTKFFRFFALTIVSLSFFVEVSCSDDWYPFDITKDKSDVSVFNMRNKLLDAPAGKNGFLKVKDDKFVFENGKEAKFWGVNLSFGACFPSHKDAEKIAEELSFFGFNVVRLHHMDYHFAPAGIFKDVDEGEKDIFNKRTGFLSDEQLEKLDYLIYQLKKRGIYVNFNLLVSRNFSFADGVVDADKLIRGGKPVAYFDRRIIELQKQYAKELLTHYNKYTNLRYCDDPAVAFVEMINEDWLIREWKYDRLNYPVKNLWGWRITKYYSDMLDDLWNDWLKKKYGTPENVINAWGLSEKDIRGGLVSVLDDWSLSLHSADAVSKVEEGAIRIDVLKTNGDNWRVQFSHKGISLKADKAYMISFSAKCNKDKLKIALFSQENCSPYGYLGLWREFYLSSNYKDYEVVFVPKKNCENAKISFLLGYSKSSVFIKDLKVEEVGAGLIVPDENYLTRFDFSRPLYSVLRLYPKQVRKDITEFYIDLERNYFNEMKEFLRKECDVKVPITGLGGCFLKEDVIAQNEMDYFDIHTYWGHPHFPYGWSMKYFKSNDASMFEDRKLGMIGGIKERVAWSKKKMPVSISEWNHCYPNPYAYESPLLMGLEGLTNGWDALYQFAFWQGAESLRKPKIRDFFEIHSNPQQLILDALAGWVYLKGDKERSVYRVEKGVLYIQSPEIQGVVGKIKNGVFDFSLFTVKPKENGAVLLFSADGNALNMSNQIVVVALSQVKNTGAERKEDCFVWGGAPTLLKRIPFDLMIKKDNVSVTAFKLNEEGEKDEKLVVNKSGGVFRISFNNCNSPWFVLEVNNKADEENTYSDDANSNELQNIELEAPGNLRASDGFAKDFIKITWDKVDGAKYYIVYRMENKSAPKQAIANCTDSFYEDYSALSGKTYFYCVKAFGNNAESSFSNLDSGYLLSAESSDAPVDVKATDGVYEDKVRISWSKVEGASLYLVYRTEKKDLVPKYIGCCSCNHFDDKEVVPGKEYFYCVKGVVNGKNTPMSAFDKGFAGRSVLAKNKPCIPTKLTASDGTYSDRVVVKWSKAKNAEFYKVFRSETLDGDLIYLGKTGNLYLVDKSVEKGKVYYYFVKSVNGSGESELSNGDKGFARKCSKKFKKNVYKKLPAPKNLRAYDGISRDYIKVKWDKVKGANYYVVYRARKVYKTKLKFKKIAVTRKIRIYDRKVLHGEYYYYKVRAVGKKARSGFSNIDMGYLLSRKKVKAPKWVRASDGRYTKRIKISWQKVKGARLYLVYRSEKKTEFPKYIGCCKYTHYNDYKVQKGKKYYYYVKALVGNVLSPMSKPEKGYRK